MISPRAHLPFAMLVLISGICEASQYSFVIPVVTRLRGAVEYTTTLEVAQPPGFGGASIHYLFRYRSPHDGSFQTAAFTDTPPSSDPIAIGDVVLFFENLGKLRSEDRGRSLYGTLEVTLTATREFSRQEVFVRARTYRVVGSCFPDVVYDALDHDGASRLLLPTQREVSFFGWRSRSNVGVVNRSAQPLDPQFELVDGRTMATLQTFRLSERIGRSLDPMEVVQLSDIFARLAADKLLIRITASGPISAYIVQLDNESHQGSFMEMPAVPQL